MDTLTKIRARRGDVERRIAKAEALLRHLRAEFGDLEIAERVVARMDGESTDQTAEIHSPEETDNSLSGRSHKDLVVEALRRSRGNWVVNWEGLQKTINEYYGVLIPKSSLMPYLSNLKRDGVIVRKGPNIALRERVQIGAGPNSDNSFDPRTDDASNNFDDEEIEEPKVKRYVWTAP